ncbi:MAG: hypothetical protein N2111_11370 [Candidatus Sumerlaeaceae bacterium]|nr:hypothetical protein [Candidatus Sumerlaeaceae bacterium]
MAALTAVLLALPSFGTGFLLDDHYHRLVLRDSGPIESAMNLFSFMRDEQDVERLRELGVLPWWTHESLRVAFWRPLSALTHWFDSRLWPDNPAWHHAHSLAWAAALVLIAGVVYRHQLGTRPAAGLAVVLFSVDDAHAIPFAWIANRNALVSMLFGLVALILHDRWRRNLSRSTAALAPLAFGLSLLGGESGVGMAAYLFAFALFLDPVPSWPRRALSLAPYAVVGLTWYAAHSLLGFGANGSEFYVDPARDPARFAAGALWRWPLLVQAQSGLVSADLISLLALPLQRGFIAGCVLWVAMLLWLLLPLLRHSPLARFYLTGMVLCLVPGFGTLPSDRLLLPCGFGFFGLLALLAGGVLGRAAWIPRTVFPRRVMFGFVAFLLFVHGPLAAGLLPSRIGNLSLLSRIVGLEPGRMPDRALLNGRQLVCPCPPGGFFLMYVGLVSGGGPESGVPMLLGLSSGVTPVQLTRLDSRTLVVEPSGGFLVRPGDAAHGKGVLPKVSVTYFVQTMDRIFRRSDHQMALGQRVQAGGCTVEVLRLTPDGRPAAIRVEFPSDLEDPRFVWMTFQQSRYEPFVPPRVGESVSVAPATFELPSSLGILSMIVPTE